MSNKRLPHKSGKSDITAFLNKMAATPRIKPVGKKARLLFAMDATASRAPTWDRACHIQGQMFAETETLGGLEIQLCYYRGFKEFYASAWVNNAADLLKYMTAVSCLGGHTQIGRVLRHVKAEHEKNKVDAVVFVGDCMEENVDALCQLAGELGLKGIPVFVFHEGKNPVAASAFKQIAKLSNGAYCSFDEGSAQQLKALLSAVAVYAAGGRRALENFGEKSGGIVLQLTRQLGNK